MTIARTLRAATAASLFVLAAACAQTSDSGAPDSAAGASEPAADDRSSADAAVLRIDQVGGYTSPAALAARIPIATVYADGRVLTQGPQTLVFPGPALPNVQVTRVAADQVDALVRRALDAGVGSAGDLGKPPVADAPTTRFTVNTDGGERSTEAYALAEGAGGALGTDLTAAQKAARQKLIDLRTEITDLSAHGTKSEAYRPAALAAYATPWTASDGVLRDQPAVAWPGPALPGKPLGGGAVETGCVTVTGDTTATVLAAAGKANAATPWTSGGKRWQLTFRPVLPDEPEDCAALAS